MDYVRILRMSVELGLNELSQPGAGEPLPGQPRSHLDDLIGVGNVLGECAGEPDPVGPDTVDHTHLILAYPEQIETNGESRAVTGGG